MLQAMQTKITEEGKKQQELSGVWLLVLVRVSIPPRFTDDVGQSLTSRNMYTDIVALDCKHESQ